MFRTAAHAGAALGVFAVAGAAQTPPRTAPVVYPIERIVAVVGSVPILGTELSDAIEEWRALGRPMPADTNAAKLEVLNDLINIEILLQKARDFGIEVPDEEIAGEVDSYIRQVRDQRFNGDDAEFRRALQTSEFRTLEGFRARQMEVQRKQRMQQLAVDSLRAKGRFPTVPVSEADVRQAFDEYVRAQPVMGPGITFRQIIVKIAPSEAEKARARAFADSLLALLRAGASFDSLARIHSADSATAANGGDLGFFRRGVMDPAFDSAAFRLPPGQLSGVVRSVHGLHILRVDRVRSAEVSARHILIREQRDSADLARTRALVARIGAALAAGASYDSLAALHHDPYEDRIISDPFPVDSLPPEYRGKIGNLQPNQVSEPIDLPDRTGRTDKVAVVQITGRSPTSAPSYERMRERLLARIREARSLERLMATLRSETYVDIRLNKVTGIGQ